MSLQTEEPVVSGLVGMPGNPAREPKVRRRPSILGANSLGEQSFNDAVILVIVAFFLAYFIAFTLRRNNA